MLETWADVRAEGQAACTELDRLCDEFPIDSALILAPCSSIHTLFMRFPIDVVFVASDGRVMRVFHALAPWRIGWTFRAFAAVELPAGTALRSGVRPGDKLRLEPGYRSVGEH